jgi:NAD(P)-dependent dehydrogenase (short-subunit alcohol dehydrogenase family)
VVFDDLHYDFREYTPFGAYGQSKTANVLFAVEATRRWAQDGITANSVMPGGIATPLQRHVLEADPDYMKKAHERFERAGRELKTPEQGAATSVLLAVRPEVDGIGGRYFEDCNEAPVVDRRPESGMGGVARYALDPGNAEHLWNVSLALIE